MINEPSTKSVGVIVRMRNTEVIQYISYLSTVALTLAVT